MHTSSNLESPRHQGLTLVTICVMIGAALVPTVGRGFTPHQAGREGPPYATIRSVWDGVYTAEQARKGEALSNAQCASCHGDRLSGGEAAPPLAGPLFNANWEGVMLSDLLDRIRTTMPLDTPGSLSRAQTADIVAYMLSLGNIPVGKTPLPADAVLLGQIKFESNRPSR